MLNGWKKNNVLDKHDLDYQPMYKHKHFIVQKNNTIQYVLLKK